MSAPRRRGHRTPCSFHLRARVTVIKRVSPGNRVQFLVRISRARRYKEIPPCKFLENVMKAFLCACAAAGIIALLAVGVLDTIQKSVDEAFSTVGTRL
jgi:hypothetical protein